LPVPPVIPVAASSSPWQLAAESTSKPEITPKSNR
jgi:hypothetical protein